MAPQEAIQVGVRLRPLVAHEKGQKSCFHITNNEVNLIPSVLDPKDVKEKEDKQWRFDHSMDSSDPDSPNFVNNAACYDKIGKSIIDHALEGYNACLFCYGQTGTGKTTTILGDKNSGPGLLILMLRDLFLEMQAEEERGGQLKVTVQMLEVYNERIYDLLAPQDSKQSVQMHVLPSGVQMQGVETHSVSSVEEVMRLIDIGNSHKHIAATAMNPQSSRGHTVFKLNILKEEDDVHLSSEVYFADLAGHENEKTTKVQGERLHELSFINKSLMWLQSAIHSLSSGGHGSHRKSTVNSTSLFRNSKLTLILANALTGNSLINVIVTISPAAVHFPTSLSSLKFANEVKHMTVQVHSSAHTDPAAEIKKLHSEVEQLKAELAIAREGNPAKRNTLLCKELEAARREAEEHRGASEAYRSRINSLEAQLDGSLPTPSSGSSRRRVSSKATEEEAKELRRSILNGRSSPSSATPSRRKSKETTPAMTPAELLSENEKLKEDLQALQRYAETTAQDHQSLQNDLGEMRTSLLDVRRELRETQEREQRLVSQQTGHFSSANGCSYANGAAVNGSASRGLSANAGLESAVFGPDVAKSLAAITAKMSELKHDLASSGLNMEHDHISALLSRAKQLVPPDIVDSMNCPSRESSGRIQVNETLLLPTKPTTPSQISCFTPSPQKIVRQQSATPRTVSPAVASQIQVPSVALAISPQRQVSAHTPRHAIATLSSAHGAHSPSMSVSPPPGRPQMASAVVTPSTSLGVPCLTKAPVVMRPQHAAAPCVAVNVYSHPQTATVVTSSFS